MEIAIQNLIKVEKDLIELNTGYKRINDEIQHYNGNDFHLTLLQKRLNEI